MLSCLVTATAMAQSVVFTESFSTDTANWATAGVLQPGYQSSGGGDGGGYIESELLTFDGNFSSSFGGPATAVLFRARDEFDSSGDALFGDWVDQQYVGLSFSIRHNAPLPMQFFARIASSNNQNGASVANGQVVLPNVWTEVVLDASRGSGEIISFGAAAGQPDSYGFVFSNIGRVQISGFEPFGLTDSQSQADLLFELDNVQLHAVPEPTSLVLVACGLLLGACPFSRRR